MKRVTFWLAVTALAVVTAASTVALAGEGPVAGVDLGVATPLNAFKDRSKIGGFLSPFVGYNLNDYVGLMANAEILGFSNKDRAGIGDNDSTWAAGAIAGPRFSLPIGDGEAYMTFQAGVFTGLAPQSPIDGTSWGYSTGGGMNQKIMDRLSLGAFLRYNRLDQRVTGNNGRDALEFLTGGISLTYDLSKPEAPPAPAPVAQAPAPTPAPTPMVKKKIVLRGVHFDFDKAVIRADDRPVLDEAIATLKQEGGVAVIAEGHTDSVGTEAYNLGLSKRRAAAVRDYLVAGGIAADRIQSEGFGESKPVASNDTADGRAQNRRVELRVIGN